MSKFLDELIENDGCRYADGSSVNAEIINSLGENARRLLEIGIVQDELVKLGFQFSRISFYGSKCHAQLVYQFPDYAYSIIIRVGKDLERVLLQMDRDRNSRFHSEEYYFDSPTWQDDLINKVKGLIECNN